MVDPCGLNVVDRPLSWHGARPVFLGRGFLTTCRSDCPGSQKSPVPNKLPCPAGRERVRYTERLARSMGSDDDMFRIWSGPEGSSHKEPLSGIRIHRAHGLYFCAVLPNRAMLDAARHPRRQFVIQKAGHDQKVYALPFSCQLVRLRRRSLALPKHRGSRDSSVMGQRLAGPRLRLRDRSTTKYLAAGRATSSKNHP